ncbi:hypothetical protein OC846_006506 [Tilletia horrida]|uniref:Uncharacterized protein n=1 Tax=Tilletia horrida TaxID=155126 RepID=A0AAN6JQJ9_9BASI|nr:hypothetical protein OC846_006506 [Tilletia horrida]
MADNPDAEMADLSLANRLSLSPDPQAERDDEEMMERSVAELGPPPPEGEQDDDAGEEDRSDDDGEGDYNPDDDEEDEEDQDEEDQDEDEEDGDEDEEDQDDDEEDDPHAPEDPVHRHFHSTFIQAAKAYKAVMEKDRLRFDAYRILRDNNVLGEDSTDSDEAGPDTSQGYQRAPTAAADAERCPCTCPNMHYGREADSEGPQRKFHWLTPWRSPQCVHCGRTELEQKSHKWVWWGDKSHKFRLCSPDHSRFWYHLTERQRKTLRVSTQEAQDARAKRNREAKELVELRRLAHLRTRSDPGPAMAKVETEDDSDDFQVLYAKGPNLASPRGGAGPSRDRDVILAGDQSRFSEDDDSPPPRRPSSRSSSRQSRKKATEKKKKKSKSKDKSKGKGRAVVPDSDEDDDYDDEDDDEDDAPAKGSEGPQARPRPRPYERARR